MKICPACHQETFDGRQTCHRCGSSITEVMPIDLPSRDPATWVSWLPFQSRRGDLQLDIQGMTFLTEDGYPLLTIPAGAVESVQPSKAADLVVRWRADGRTRKTRFRVRWAPAADPRLMPEFVPVGGPIRSGVMGVRGSRRRRTTRDLTVVRNRWQSALEMLLNADRYAIRRVH